MSRAQRVALLRVEVEFIRRYRVFAQLLLSVFQPDRPVEDVQEALVGIVCGVAQT